MTPGSPLLAVSPGAAHADDLLRVLLLSDYNTRVVVLGVTCLGAAAGVIGSFVLLRKRSLLGDALSHAMLPGIGLAFMLMTALGMAGKSLPGLLLGATLSGVLAVACILLITRCSRIKEDAALGIVLSVFFGLGVVVLSLVQRMQGGSAAGLNSFIYGKTASMLAQDALLILVGGGLAAALCVLLYKELALLCFDAGYAGAQGWPTLALDALLMALVVLVSVIGLQAVGLILMIALLVIPPAAARFWTHHLPTMILAAAAIGAASGYLGAGLSALAPRLPSGAIIVLVAGAAFALSLLFGPARGLLARVVEQARLARRVARQHLLRAIYERLEDDARAAGGLTERTFSFHDLLAARSGSVRALRDELRRAERAGLLRQEGVHAYRLTAAGEQAAWRVVRNHRLWELFLISHADIAPSHVDRDADMVEHVLDAAMVRELETLLAVEHPALLDPPSPHALPWKTRAAP